MSLATSPSIESIRFESLSFSHENHDPTLKNCDFSFLPGAFSLQSMEGAGKSTVLQILAGLLVPQSGGYLINDNDVSLMTFEEFLPYRLRIGFTFDYGGLINNRSISENLILPLVYHKLISESEALQRVEAVLDFFEIAKYAHERPAHVPGRVRKLSVLLRALVIRPQVLLLDDPSVGLSDSTQKLLVEYIKMLISDHGLKFLFMASYDEAFKQEFNLQVLQIDNGLIYGPYQQNLQEAV